MIRVETHLSHTLMFFSAKDFFETILGHVDEKFKRPTKSDGSGSLPAFFSNSDEHVIIFNHNEFKFADIYYFIWELWVKKNPQLSWEFIVPISEDDPRDDITGSTTQAIKCSTISAGLHLKVEVPIGFCQEVFKLIQNPQ